VLSPPICEPSPTEVAECKDGTDAELSGLGDEEMLSLRRIGYLSAAARWTRRYKKVNNKRKDRGEGIDRVLRALRRATRAQRRRLESQSVVVYLDLRFDC
jgi:hypothetical protein